MSQYLVDLANLGISISTTAGDETVTANDWTPSDNISAGDWIIINDNGIPYVIASVGASSFELAAKFPTTLSNVDAVIHRDFTNNGLAIPHFNVGDLNVAAILTRAMETIAQGLGAGLVAKGLILAEQTTPPGGPSTGDAYIVTATATGDWAGKEGEIATYDGADWTFSGTPADGWWVYNADTDTLRIYAGGQWNDWTAALSISGGTSRIWFTFQDEAEATGAGNVDYMQAESVLRSGGLVTGMQITQADARPPTAGNTVLAADSTNYASSTQEQTLNLAHNANAAASSGWTAITIAAAGTVYIYISSVDASGGHERIMGFLEVFEL